MLHVFCRAKETVDILLKLLLNSLAQTFPVLQLPNKKHPKLCQVLKVQTNGTTNLPLSDSIHPHSNLSIDSTDGKICPASQDLIVTSRAGAYWQL